MSDTTMNELTMQRTTPIKLIDVGDGTYVQAVVDWMKKASWVNINSATTTVIKSGAGTLQRIVMNKPLTLGSVTLYDNTAGSGTKIGTISLPLALLSDVWCIDYGLSFSTGLTIVTGSAMDLTVVYV